MLKYLFDDFFVFNKTNDSHSSLTFGTRERVHLIEEFLGIDRQFFCAEECFAVQVKGDSMVDAHIQDGDYVIIKIQGQAQNGDILAALIEDDVTLKYFYRTRNQIRLDSANPRYPSLIFKKSAHKSFRILGVMTGLVRKRHRAQ